MPQQPLKRVLVTGGAGYIGSHIVLILLLTRQYKVLSIDNSHNSFPEALKRATEIATEALPADATEQDRDSAVVEAFSGDLRSRENVEKVFAGSPVWGVIHVAALKAVGESSEIPLDYYAVNVGATIQLLQIMAEHGCYNMVYSSSATVYGTPPVVPIPETTPLKAESVYGRTKVMCETILSDVCTSYPDKWRAISLRYFNPAGAHTSGRMGEDPRGKPGNLLPLLSQIAIGKFKDDPLKVFGNDYPTPDGTCVRDYIHILDLARGHLLALEALSDERAPGSKISPDIFPKQGGKFKAYNLGKGRGQSVLSMIEAMRKASGFNYQYEIIGRRVGDVPDLTADPALARKELGFDAPLELDTMCEDLWRWQSMNPDGYGQ
ncbi:UDP-glucose 4-epimerase [Dacryopinax primogenitus]|uniref:UDP-glucose 4-epimerase n=1 Tax=Dacryopinax primogenitus (strain DJM 731) TaxID=1858805 RepID=M5FX42_DACPD|nr:UDP-glucose 4-epimerase [Dacryopinax primogenitus]EJU02556.1 UDP-glucose 4-epimerase [Dacryopinax primogenitus]